MRQRSGDKFFETGDHIKEPTEEYKKDTQRELNPIPYTSTQS